MKKYEYNLGFNDGYEFGYDDALTFVTDTINRVLDSKSPQVIYKTKAMLPYKTHEKLRFVVSDIAELKCELIRLQNKLNDIKNISDEHKIPYTYNQTDSYTYYNQTDSREVNKYESIKEI